MDKQPNRWHTNTLTALRYTHSTCTSTQGHVQYAIILLWPMITRMWERVLESRLKWLTKQGFRSGNSGAKLDKVISTGLQTIAVSWAREGTPHNTIIRLHSAYSYTHSPHTHKQMCSICMCYFYNNNILCTLENRNFSSILPSALIGNWILSHTLNTLWQFLPHGEKYFCNSGPGKNL